MDPGVIQGVERIKVFTVSSLSPTTLASTLGLNLHCNLPISLFQLRASTRTNTSQLIVVVLFALLLVLVLALALVLGLALVLALVLSPHRKWGGPRSGPGSGSNQSVYRGHAFSPSFSAGKELVVKCLAT